MLLGVVRPAARAAAAAARCAVPRAMSAAAGGSGPVHERPTSPHVTIYKFPLNATLSIAHRGSGTMMGLGAPPVRICISCMGRHAARENPYDSRGRPRDAARRGATRRGASACAPAFVCAGSGDGASPPALRESIT